jgi:hypothetical protein
VRDFEKEMVFYKMEYSISAGQENRRIETFYADNDEEAVKLSKQKFLELAEQDNLPSTTSMNSVYREPKNLLNKSFRLSIKKGKDIFSLIEE